MKLDDCDQPEEMLTFFREYAKDPKGFLLLAGRNGTGKTFAAEAIQADFFTPNHDPWSEISIFYTQTDLNLVWQNQISKWGDILSLVKELEKVPLLILDDLGTRAPTPAFMDFLYAIIDKRERKKQESGTIITTNLNAESMRRDFGDAIVSRVASGKVFRFDGKDRRFKDF